MVWKKSPMVFSVIIILFSSTIILASQVKLAELSYTNAKAPNISYQHQLSHDVEEKRTKSKTAHTSCLARVYSLWKHHPILCLCGLGSLLGGALSCFWLKEASPLPMAVFAPVSHPLSLHTQEKTNLTPEVELKLKNENEHVQANLEHIFSANKMLTTLRKRQATTSAQNQFQPSLKNVTPTIRLVATAAIVHENYEKRKEQYIQGLKLLNTIRKKSGRNLYILESCEKGPTFLDTYCFQDGCTVFYTQNNEPELLNYGINLAKSLLIGLKHFDFSPDDMIIILNGRYTPVNDEFVQFVDKHPTADVIAKIWNKSDAYTALFAMKAKYLLDFLENHIDLSAMEKKNIPFEYCFGEFITKLRQQKAEIIDLDIPKLYNLPVVANRDYVSRFFKVDR